MGVVLVPLICVQSKDSGGIIEKIGFECCDFGCVEKPINHIFKNKKKSLYNTPMLFLKKNI